MNDAEIDELISSLLLKSIISSEKLATRAFLFQLSGNRRIWQVRLDLPDEFPHCLPKARLLDSDQIGRIPHVNQSGVICVEESDSILCNHYCAQGIVKEFLSDVVKLLDRVSLTIYEDELLDELEGYYSQTYNINSFYEPGDAVELIQLKIYRQRKQLDPKHLQPLVIFDSGASKTFSDTERLGQYQTIKIAHLPLERAVLPPANAVSMDSAYVEGLIEYLSEPNKRILTRFLKKIKPYFAFFIFVSMPRSSGEKTQFLLKLTTSKSANHPLKVLGKEWDVTLYTVSRSTKSFLVNRGGADSALHGKRVGVIGCGSVGGVIADALGKAGISNLVLVDPDLLLPENIHRHILGGGSISYLPSKGPNPVSYLPKTHALFRHLTNELPNMNVVPLDKVFSESLARSHLADCDIIISAVGAPSTNLQINSVLKSLGHRHLIFCWNEAASIGGHSVVHDLSETCLECLHTDEQGSFGVNRLSLVAPGQNISKNLTGCGGVFTPFTYLDSMRTAQMATSQALKILQGNNANYADSWKGELSQPLIVSRRYDDMGMMERININRADKCGQCSG